MSRLMRTGVRAVLVTLIAGFISAIVPGSASAGAIVPCPTDYHDVSMPKPFEIYFDKYTILSSTPVFRVSDGRVLDNGLPFPVDYKITSSVSTTVKVVVSVGFQSGATEQFRTNINTQIEASRMIAEYGVESYFIHFGASVWRWRGNRGCEEWGWYPQSTYAPTAFEGWRLRLG